MVDIRQIPGSLEARVALLTDPGNQKSQPRQAGGDRSRRLTAAKRQMRRHLAALAGRSPDTVPPGAITYQLRRLRLHGMIERIPRSHRYRVTDAGFRTALFFVPAAPRSGR